MKAIRVTIAIAALGIFMAASAAAESPQAVDPRLDFLKQLAGTWTGTFDSAEMGGEQAFEFRVTAGGHAVEEREMIGTPMEMLTVYYMQDSDLLGTHFCMLGNRPTVTAAAKIVDDTLVFGCNETPGGSKSHDEAHVHGWSIRLADDGRLHYSAELVADGKVTEQPATILTRVVDSAAR